MTRKYKPAPRPLDSTRRTPGYLSCFACHRTIPYTGYADRDIEGWPQHRCDRFRDYRPFDQFTLDEPFRPVLPPQVVIMAEEAAAIDAAFKATFGALPDASVPPRSEEEHDAPLD